VERLSGICGQVCVSGNSAVVVQADVIEDPVASQGPAIGVAAALAYAGRNSFDACLVTPIDMPLLTPDDLSRLRRLWEKERELCCAVSAGDQRLQPLVAVYPVSFQERLRDLANSDDRSLSRWLKTQAPLTVTLSSQSCQNVNTLEDLADGCQ